MSIIHEKSQPPHKYLTPFEEGATNLALRRYGVERDIVAVVLAKPLAGVAMAAEYGVAMHSFEHEDLRIIYEAARLVGHQGIDAVLRFARRGLQHFGLWDPHGAIGGRSCLWSDENLVRLAEEWFFSPLVLASRCNELNEIEARQQEISDLLHRVEKLLDGSATPATNRPAQSHPRLVIVPRKRGVA